MTTITNEKGDIQNGNGGWITHGVALVLPADVPALIRKGWDCASQMAAAEAVKSCDPSNATAPMMLAIRARKVRAVYRPKP